MSTTYHTWANLQPDTPFAHIFPDGEVPIVSIAPIRPDSGQGPLSYVVDASQLSEPQIYGLAELLLQKHPNELLSICDAADYVRDGLPIKCEWFSGFGTTRYDLVASLAEAETADASYWEGDAFDEN